MSKTEYQIIDNFLPIDDFKRLSEIVMGNGFAWYWQPNINEEHKSDVDYTSYFTHMCYNHNNVNSPTFYEFEKILKLLDVKAIIRLKINCYPNTGKFDTHEAHSDYPYSHKGCIFYFNTCNGYTILNDGTRIESIANRALLFDPSLPHQSTNATDVKARFNVNMNYF